MKMRGPGYASHEITREHLLAPYRSLALRVISTAVHDLMTPGQSAAERGTARAFLSGSRMLTHWCGLAGLNPETIRQQMRGFVEESRLQHSRREH